MGDDAGVIPLDAESKVVARIADYHAGRFPPAQAHSGAKGWGLRGRIGMLAQRLGRLGRAHAEHPRRIFSPPVGVQVATPAFSTQQYQGADRSVRAAYSVCDSDLRVHHDRYRGHDAHD
jgi:hypothetical protein